MPAATELPLRVGCRFPPSFPVALMVETSPALAGLFRAVALCSSPPGGSRYWAG